MFLPTTIHEEGFLRLSTSWSLALWIKNWSVVSKDIFIKAELLNFKPYLLKQLNTPYNVK